MRSGSTDSVYAHAMAKASEIEAELRLLRRWSVVPLSPEKFENMGAFGSNTMSFEQWIQFVLIPRIHNIVEKHETFPDGSMLGPYAIRVFDGDLEASNLHNLLYELDEIINRNPQVVIEVDQAPDSSIPSADPNQTVTLGDTSIPSVLFTLSDLLPQFNGESLESQLQTFDMFLSILSPSVRNQIAQLLMNAAENHLDDSSKNRIRSAAQSILRGGRAAEPYNHERAMKTYSEDFKRDRS